MKLLGYNKSILLITLDSTFTIRIMCLAVPAKILEIKDNKAKASVQGAIVEADLSLIENPRVGEYILIHTGIALEKIDQEKAKEDLEIIAEFTIPPSKTD